MDSGLSKKQYEICPPDVLAKTLWLGGLLSTTASGTLPARKRALRLRCRMDRPRLTAASSRGGRFAIADISPARQDVFS